MAYAPNVLIVLLNTEHWLRPLFVEQQATFYASASAILPLRGSARCGAGEWNLKAFDRVPCEGVADSVRVGPFARRAKLEALLARRSVSYAGLLLAQLLKCFKPT